MALQASISIRTSRRQRQRCRPARPATAAWLILALAVAGCGGPTGAQENAGPASPDTAVESDRHDAALAEQETRRLNVWLDERYEELLDFSPIRKTILGRKENYGELDDLSEAAEDEQLEWQRNSVRDLERSFDYERLTADGRISYDLWVYQLQQAEAALPFRRHEYLFHQMQGWHTTLPQFLINFHRVDTDADMEAYVSRIGEAGRAMRQVLERAKAAAAEDIRPPRFAYDAVLEQARAVVAGIPFDGEGDSPIWADAGSKIDALVEAGDIDARRAETLRTDVRHALVERMKPAYDELIAWLEQDLPNTDEDAAGVWSLPNGEDYYDERLAAATTTELSAAEIHEIGLREVARIKDEMESIRQGVEFDGTLDEFFTFVREAPEFYFPDTDEGREAYLDAAREYLGYIEQQLPDWFGLLPKAGLVVRRVEPFREQPGGAQHYMQGSPDGSRPGVYYAHLIDMTAMPKPQMEVIAYHEGLPGHHMQISIAQELTGVPMFRTQAYFNAYTEGWGLYAELLAKEMGAYRDPYSDFGRLTTEIWRAIRLVVDTGLHAMGWTEEEAVEYFMANSPAAEGQIRSEVRRYLVMPGQATGYKIGMLEILRLRDEARDALGRDFDIRGFHDAVLGGGALPLSILERRIDDWIEAERQAAADAA